ncbi:MAG: hypothetical protein ABI597_08845 [Gammaproteobacteria bacterium]
MIIRNITTDIDPKARHTRYGYKGMLQFHFAKENAAQQFIKQVKTHPARPADIDKVNVKHEKCENTFCYVARLTQEQADQVILKATSITQAQVDKTIPKAIPVLFEEKQQIVSVILPPYPDFPTHVFLKEKDIQLHFANELEAKGFHRRINGSLNIKNEHCAFKHLFGNCHIISLNEEQLNNLCGENAYSLLKNINEQIVKNNFSVLENETSQIKNALLLNLVALLRFHDGWCILKRVARHQSPEVFQAYVAKLENGTCNKTALLQSPDGKCTLRLVAQYQSSEAFQAYLAKLDADTCKQAALLQDENGECTVLVVARYQSADGFQAYLKRLDISTAIRTLLLLNSNYEFGLGVAAHSQSHTGFGTVLEKLSTNEGKEQFNAWIKNGSNWRFYRLVINITIYQSADNVSTFLNVLDQKLWQLLEQTIKPSLNDSFTRRVLRKSFSMYSTDDNFFRILGRTLMMQAPQGMIKHSSLVNDLVTHNLKYSAVSRGKQYYSAVNEILSNSILFKHSDLIFDYAFPEKAVTELFENGKALVKIIRTDREKNWKQFCESLADYNIREALRKTGEKTGWKFVHIPAVIDEKEEKRPALAVDGNGKIVSCRTKEEQVQHKQDKKNRVYTHTKKTPTTYISSYLHTGLFGYAHTEREMVGLAFDITQCRVKALLSQDHGTFKREWLSKDRNDVVAYANRMQAISFTSFEQFRSLIDRQPYAVNEVLAKVTRESVIAIVVGRDTPKARKIAQQRQANFEVRFQRYLPIVIYNPEQQNVYPCFSEEVHEQKRFGG